MTAVSSAIHLVVTVAESQIQRIPFFVAHYRALGVTQFWLTVHSEKTPDEISDSQLRAVAGPFLHGLPVELFLLRGSHDAMLIRSHHDQLIQHAIDPGSWIVWADIDELQIYRSDLPEMLARADRSGAQYIGGEMVDRVGPNGELARLDPNRDLWAQFPVGCSLTATIVGGWTHKVVASKSDAPVGTGNHEPLTPVPSSAWAGDLVAIHHFKWDATVKSRLARRLEPDWKSRCHWWVETEQVMSFLHGRSAVDLSALDTFHFADGRHLPTDTGAWAFVQQLRRRNRVWQDKWEALSAEP